MGNCCCCFKCDDNLERKVDEHIDPHSRQQSVNRGIRVQPPIVSLERLTITNERLRNENQISNVLAANIQRRNAERDSLRKKKEFDDAEKRKEIEKQKAIQIQNQVRQKKKELDEAEKKGIEKQKAIQIQNQMKQREQDLSQQLKSLTIESPEKVVKNTEMIDSLLMEINRPSHYSCVMYHKENLDQLSWEYERVESLFRATNKRCFTVEKIEKIDNPYLLLQYSLKKMKYMAKFGRNVEQELFHGTRKCNIDNICINNFNWRLRGTAKGHKFGQGISFTPISNYATHYGDDGYNKVMFLVKVLVANKCIGAQHMDIPPNDYDTTTNEKEHVIVKYEDNDFYPAYVIYYGGVDMYKNGGRGGRGRNRGGYRRYY